MRADVPLVLFDLIGDVIPCELCKNHYKSYLQTNPVSAEESPFIWTIKLHNSVNEKLGKYSNYDLRDGLIAHDHPCTHDYIQIIIPYLKQNEQLFQLFLDTYPCPECSLVEQEKPLDTVKLCVGCETPEISALI